MDLLWRREATLCVDSLGQKGLNGLLVNVVSKEVNEMSDVTKFWELNHS